MHVILGCTSQRLYCEAETPSHPLDLMVQDAVHDTDIVYYFLTRSGSHCSHVTAKQWFGDMIIKETVKHHVRSPFNTCNVCTPALHVALPQVRLARGYPTNSL